MGEAAVAAKRETNVLRSLARSHFANSRRLARRLVAAEMLIEQLKRERVK